MLYVIQRIPEGDFVTGPGSKYSYSKDIMKAYTYRSVDSAKSDCCGNEQVVSIYSFLQPPRD